MRMRDGVEMLEVAVNLRGTPGFIYPTLLWDSSQAILVDTGFPGQLQSVRAAVESAGVQFERLSTVILTHHDIDHIGGLAALREALPGLRVLSGEVERAYIQGEKTPLKLAQLEANLPHLPEEQKAIYAMMKAGFERSFAPVDQTVADGETLPWLGGIRVIDTPGHTLGHVCLYLPEVKVLVAGDALAVENGQMVPAAPVLNADQDLSRESLKKLARLDVEAVICYHGGLYQADPNRRLAELAA